MTRFLLLVLIEIDCVNKLPISGACFVFIRLLATHEAFQSQLHLL